MLDVAFDADLTVVASSETARQRACLPRVLALAALLVGVEHEAPLVGTLQQHDTGGRRAVRGGGRQRHGVGILRLVRPGLIQPLLEPGKRISDELSGVRHRLVFLAGKCTVALRGLRAKRGPLALPRDGTLCHHRSDSQRINQCPTAPPQGTVLQGKRGLIMGVTNDRSLGWGIAAACAAQGAELAFTYQVERWGAGCGRWRRRSVRIGCFCATWVTSPASMRRSRALREHWDGLDFLVHAIAFADKTYLRGRYLDTPRGKHSPAGAGHFLLLVPRPSRSERCR